MCIVLKIHTENFFQKHLCALTMQFNNNLTTLDFYIIVTRKSYWVYLQKDLIYKSTMIFLRKCY